MTMFILTVDARAMEGFGKPDSALVFLDSVTCKGSERHLNMCVSALPTGECSSAGVTCRKSSSESDNNNYYSLS